MKPSMPLQDNAYSTVLLPTPDINNDDSVEKKSWEAYNALILDAYRTTFNKEPDIGEDGHTRLSFSSAKDAETFFQDIASENIPFFAINIGADGRPTGEYMMSYGDGQLHKGHCDPGQINALHKEFKNKVDSKQFKHAMMDMKSQSNPAVSHDQETAPTPLAQTPRVHSP